MKKKIKDSIIIKAATIAALMISLLFLASSTCSKKNDLKCISLCFSYPVNSYKEKDEIKIYNLKDTISIFYYSDYLIYRLSPTVRFETGEKVKGTEPYFIYNKKNKLGLLFSSLEDSTQGITYPVDSFLINRALKGKDLDIPVDSLWSLIGVVKGKDGILIEKYGSIKPGDEMTIDSIYYYYSKKMIKVEYSFSKKLDSVNRMKLFKARFLFNSKYSSSNKIVLPKRELSLEMREEIASDSKEILSLVKKFQNGNRSLK